MKKYSCKPFIPYLLIICLLAPLGANIYAENTSSYNENGAHQEFITTLESSYNIINNIEKQLSNTLRNYFLHLVNPDITQKPNPKSLAIYTSQLIELKQKLNDLPTANLTVDELSSLEILLSAVMYLNFIINKTVDILKSKDAGEQYVLFRSILYMEDLLSQNLNYLQSKSS